jgi:L-alanine-DL-glutamate epimerase-like enolase superfamily enzyme
MSMGMVVAAAGVREPLTIAEVASYQDDRERRGVAHLMRVTETAYWLEWQDRANPIMKESFDIKNGHLEVPDRPGIGLEWDENAIARYSY